MKESRSQTQIGISDRVIYLAKLTRLHYERLTSPRDFSALDSDLEQLSELFEAHTGQSISSARVIEVGFGQRPFRLIGFHSRGIDVCGIDLDESVLHLSLLGIARALRRNGPLRALKSTLRRISVDRYEYLQLAEHLSASLQTIMPGPERLHQGDVAQPATWASLGHFDLIYSEDVLEHIPPHDLDQVLTQLRSALTENGLVILKPMIFTGISGAHDVDWYPTMVDRDIPGRTPAWGHLTAESKPVDTYLNRLTLAEYREALGRHFEILEEFSIFGRLGEQHLTEDRRQALAGWADEELFSNAVRFALRPNVEGPTQEEPCE